MESTSSRVILVLAMTSFTLDVCAGTKIRQRHLRLLTRRNAKAFLHVAHSHKQCATSCFFTRRSGGDIMLPHCAGTANPAGFTTASVTKHLRCCAFVFYF
uniref:Putative secreted protein n=1 Tax=Ixodes ricinus TaxID=34613 RepID=A0A6B0UEJ2_IXORI